MATKKLTVGVMNAIKVRQRVSTPHLPPYALTSPLYAPLTKMHVRPFIAAALVLFSPLTSLPPPGAGQGGRGQSDRPCTAARRPLQSAHQVRGEA